MNGMSQSSEALNVDYIGLTAAVVSAYLSNNHVQSAEIVALIAATHAALYGVGQSNATAAARPVEGLAPTQIRKSITHGALISFEDGKAYKTLGRHLRSRGLTPKTYREKWGLPRD